MEKDNYHSSKGDFLKFLNNNDSPDNKNYYPGDDYLHPISIIEVQSDRRKRLWLKVIAFFVAFVFFFQQIGFADVYSYKRLGGVAEEVLPSSQEYDQTGRYAPGYLKRQQQKHEEIIRQRMGKDELMEQLIRKPRPVEDMPLKKKKSAGGGGGAVNFTLTEPDFDEGAEDPHNYNDLMHDESTSALEQIDTYDITKYPPIDVEYWKSKDLWKCMWIFFRLLLTKKDPHAFP